MYIFGYALIAIAVPLCVIGLGIITKEVYYLIDELIFDLRN